MAAHLQLLLLLSLLTVKYSAGEAPFFIAGVSKDAASLQYTTQLLIGTPQLPVKLVVDLSGRSLWVHCASPSSSRQFIRHGSLSCSMAKSGGRSTKTGVDPIRTTTVCDIRQGNSVTGAATTGDLAGDFVAVDGIVDGFMFSCVPEYLLKGLASGAKGMLGLGRSKTSFPSQLVNKLAFHRKFSVCLSSSAGFIISGTGISKSLSYTPLVSIQTPTSDEYYFNVNSIKINGKKLVLHAGKPIGAVEISTVVPYTTMKTTTYKIFTKGYIQAAASMNMTMVSPVVPFGVCFGFRQPVPEIELVLQSEFVKWRIPARNSMVKVNDDVMCLGFLDGGVDMSSEVVLGGYQLEDHIMEFDLGTGMMGFSSSLLTADNSCSSIKESVSRQRESL